MHTGGVVAPAGGAAIAAGTALGTVLRAAHPAQPAQPQPQLTPGAGGPDGAAPFVSGELVVEAQAGAGGGAASASAPGGSNGGNGGNGGNGPPPYFRQLYGNGTLCGLTGQPRQAEVRLYCAPDKPSHVSSVKEVSTCSYLLSVSSGALCAHPAFHTALQGREPPSVPIRCEPEPEEPEEGAEEEEGEARAEEAPAAGEEGARGGVEAEEEQGEEEEDDVEAEAEAERREAEAEETADAEEVEEAEDVEARVGEEFEQSAADAAAEDGEAEAS